MFYLILDYLLAGQGDVVVPLSVVNSSTSTIAINQRCDKINIVCEFYFCQLTCLEVT